MAKIAIDRGTDPIAHETVRPEPGGKPPEARLLAAGAGWMIHDIICRSGPADPSFEEQHRQSSVAIVLSGTFQYRTSTGCELMTPGSLLLGNSGDAFTCGHEHGIGDRCIAIRYSDELREEAGGTGRPQPFGIPRIPAIRNLAPQVAGAASLLRNGAEPAACEELVFQVLDRASRLQYGFSTRGSKAEPSALARVTRVVRAIEFAPDAPHDLSQMAAEARLSPYHFLRCFEALTGSTPHQYLLRTRLRRAAIRLQEERTKIVEIAFDCGFGDVSNFNRAFRAEFGMSPRAYRRI